MLCFSYHFFVNSFIRQRLLGYASSFLFHILHRFNFNILHVLQNSIGYLFSKLSTCISYGLSIRHLYIDFIFNLVHFFYFNLLGVVTLLVVHRLHFLKYLVWNNISKLMLYIYLYNTNLLGVFHIHKYLKAASMLRKKYIKYNGTFAFPIKNNIITLLRSPHIDKKARDQFAHTNYRVVLTVRKVPIHFPLFAHNFLQHSSNASFKTISMVHYVHV